MQDDSLFPTGDFVDMSKGFCPKVHTTPIASISVLSPIERVNLVTFVCERIYTEVVDHDSLNKSGEMACHNTIMGTDTKTNSILTWEDAAAIMNDYLKKYMAIHQLSILTKKRNPKNRLFQLHIKTHTRAIKDIRTLVYDELDAQLRRACSVIRATLVAERERIKKEAEEAELAIIRDLREARKREAQQQKEAELREQEKRTKEQEQRDLIARLHSIVLDIADDEWD